MTNQEIKKLVALTKAVKIFEQQRESVNRISREVHYEIRENFTKVPGQVWDEVDDKLVEDLNANLKSVTDAINVFEDTIGRVLRETDRKQSTAEFGLDVEV